MLNGKQMEIWREIRQHMRAVMKIFSHLSSVNTRHSLALCVHTALFFFLCLDMDESLITNPKSAAEH